METIMKRIYKTELHCHTSEVSPCAHMTGEETIEKYLAAGYTSLVITNHFDACRVGGPMNYKVRYDTYEEQVIRHYEVIREIRELAAGRINIIDGFEMSTYHSGNDYLVFGMTEEETLSKNLFSLSMEDLKKHINALGCLIIQAHPMRRGMTIVDPDLVDGYEVYNGDLEAMKYNEVAYHFALVAGNGKKILTVGNDHHLREEPLRAAILTDVPIEDAKQLVSVLKSGTYSLHVTDADYLPTAD